MEDKLKSSNGRIKLIVTDGVFSMDGNVAPLDKICDLADKYGALTFVDDCHATGFFGKTGRFVAINKIIKNEKKNNYKISSNCIEAPRNFLIFLAVLI